MKNRKQRKWHVGSGSGHLVTIEENWRVLDIGSGHNPHPRADVLLDREVGKSIHRSGEIACVDSQRVFILADACSLPFKDRAFDFILTCHIAEHVENPKIFCEECIRVGKQGYIEAPSKLCEKILGEPFHKWLVYEEGSHLIFERKCKPTGTKWFYGLFYYGQERVGHPNIAVSHGGIHFLLKVVNYAILGLWRLKPIRRWMYTCFEWKGSFNFRVR